jgi:hypothetical protein
MRKDTAALEEHLGQIAQTELVAQAPHHDQTDHVTGILKAIERSPRAFVEFAVTPATPKAAIA